VSEAALVLHDFPNWQACAAQCKLAVGCIVQRSFLLSKARRQTVHSWIFLATARPLRCCSKPGAHVYVGA
jgi:hypothetical protein